MPNYQGKEITATLQANTKAQLDKLISGLNRYARSNGLERIKVLSKGKDPDGGYKAIIEAHNWNPFKVAKSKYDMRLSAEEKIEVEEAKHAIKMRKIRMKREAEKEKKLLAVERLGTAQIKAQRKAIKQKSKGTGLGSLFTEFIKAEPPKKKTRPKTKKRKSQSQPRMVTLRMN